MQCDGKKAAESGMVEASVGQASDCLSHHCITGTWRGPDIGVQGVGVRGRNQ